jgi:hypothetical protein
LVEDLPVTTSVTFALERRRSNSITRRDRFRRPVLYRQVPRWIALLIAGAGAMALGAAALTSVEAMVATPATDHERTRGATPSVRERLARDRPIGSQGRASRGPWSRHADVDDARPWPAADREELRDASALASFDEAFAGQGVDPGWSDATKRSIRATLSATPDAPVLERADCRSTLCRLELRGSADTLPTAPPFDGIAWWIDGGDGRAQLLLVRDGAEIPLPTEQ